MMVTVIIIIMIITNNIDNNSDDDDANWANQIQQKQINLNLNAYGMTGCTAWFCISYSVATSWMETHPTKGYCTVDSTYA